MQRHGFSVFALILVSVYISNPKWCWLISIVETCHGEYFQAVSFCSSFLTRKKKLNKKANADEKENFIADHQ